MVEVARSAGLLLVEAMWTRFLPTMQRVREILAAGTLGRIVYLTAEHSLSEAYAEADRIWDPVYRSADAQEGPAAFRDKRRPAWTGR